jgi:uncharacterized protein YbjT (DUF2867 family)
VHVLVAGASGGLGRLVAAELARRGASVRAFARREVALDGIELVRGDVRDAAATRAALHGVEIAVSTLGASVSLAGRGWLPFTTVDPRLNAALLAAAAATGVRKIVYVSTFGADRLQSGYARAHAAVERLLAQSGLALAVVRPTGFFTAYEPFLEMARKGRAFDVGDGTARINPIAPEDVARACADAVEAGEGVREVGGPRAMRRREIVELAFHAAGRAPRVRAVPVGAARALSALLFPFHPRLAQIGLFAAELAGADLVAPALGTRTLEDFFAARVTRDRRAPV